MVKKTVREKNPGALADQVNQYIAGGGTVKELPAAPDHITIVGRQHGKQKKRRRAVKLSAYEAKPIPKAEAMGNRLNLHSQDFQTIPGGGVKGKLQPGEICAALAMGGLKPQEQDLVIYYWTQDRKSRSGAWALLMCKVVDNCLAENWGNRKRGILIAMVETCLDELINPAQYRMYSDRKWSRSIGLANSSHWRTYSGRYNNLRAFAKDILNRGDECLEQQL